MDNLLDTHTLIWFLEGDASLSQKAKQKIEAAGIVNYVSIVSFWEIAIKVSLGKLEIKSSFSDLMNIVSLNGFKVLPLSFKDTLIISNLPFHHRDPFDRMIIAQVMNNNLLLLSKDKNFIDYAVSLAW